MNARTDMQRDVDALSLAETARQMCGRAEEVHMLLIDAAVIVANLRGMTALAKVLDAARAAECEDRCAWVDSDECHLAADRLESAARSLAQKTRAVADYADEAAQERA